MAYGYARCASEGDAAGTRAIARRLLELGQDGARFLDHARASVADGLLAKDKKEQALYWAQEAVEGALAEGRNLSHRRALRLSALLMRLRKMDADAVREAVHELRPDREATGAWRSWGRKALDAAFGVRR